MQYYRRSDLHLTNGARLNSVDETVAKLVAPQFFPTQVENLLTTLPAQPTTPTVTDIAAIPAGTIPSIHAPHVPHVDKLSRENASTLVQRASEILDKEMALGLLTTQKASPTLFGVPSGYPGLSPIYTAQIGTFTEELTRHVEQLITGFYHLLQQSQQNEHLIASAASQYAGNQPAEDSVPVLRTKQAVRAGEQAILSMRVHNESTEPVRTRLSFTDLMNHAGDTIPAQQISASPANLILAPDSVQDVHLTVQIPLSTPGSTYSGLLSSAELPYLCAVVRVTVR